MSLERHITRWVTSGGAFDALDDLLPSSVLHAPPDAGDDFVRPLFVGFLSLQAASIGSSFLTDFQSFVGSIPTERANEIFAAHRRVLDRWEPELSLGSLRVPSGKTVSYERLLCPVHLKSGAKMILVHSQPVTLQ